MELSPERTHFNESFLDQMRATGDDLADSVLTELLRKGDISKANQALAAIKNSARPCPYGPPR